MVPISDPARRRFSWWLAILAAGLVAVAAAPLVPAAGAASSANPQLFYTTNSPPQLKVVPYRADGDRIRVGSPRVVAQLPAADGLAIAADGSLLVGGGKTGNVYKINPDTGTFTTQPSGAPTRIS